MDLLDRRTSRGCELTDTLTGKMLLLFLCLVLGTPQGQGVNVTCDNVSLSKDQQLTLCCTLDYTAIQTLNHGTNDTTCVTEWYVWKCSDIVKRSCTEDCHMEETEAPSRKCYYTKGIVTKADEGKYTFSIGTNCGTGSGTTSFFNVPVTVKSVDNGRDQQDGRDQQAPVWLALVVIISVIAVLGVLLFLKTSRSGRGLMERLKSSMTQSNNNTNESPEGSREALNMVSA